MSEKGSMTGSTSPLPDPTGFNSDPSVVSVDDDYYIATSTFACALRVGILV